MITNSWQSCFEDHKVILLWEVGVFFFVVSDVISDITDTPFWLSIAFAAIYEILAIVRFLLLINNKRKIQIDRFPRFLLPWQFIFWGGIHIIRSHELPRIWMSVSIITAALLNVLYLARKTIKTTPSES